MQRFVQFGCPDQCRRSLGAVPKRRLDRRLPVPDLLQTLISEVNKCYQGFIQLTVAAIPPELPRSPFRVQNETVESFVERIAA